MSCFLFALLSIKLKKLFKNIYSKVLEICNVSETFLLLDLDFISFFVSFSALSFVNLLLIEIGILRWEEREANLFSTDQHCYFVCH